MKKLLVFAFMAAFASASAFAGDVDQNPPGCKPGECPPPACTKTVCFNVVCHYKAKDDHDGYHKCQAAAKFIKKVTMDGGEITDDSDHFNNPQFEVSCDDHLIYNDGARRFTDMLGTRIQGQTGPYPAILLPRGALHAGHHYAQSWLELGDQDMSGACYIYIGEQ